MLHTCILVRSSRRSSYAKCCSFHSVGGSTLHVDIITYNLVTHKMGSISLLLLAVSSDMLEVVMQ